MLVVIVLGAGISGGSQVQASGCDVSNRYPEKVRRWCDLITRYAGEANSIRTGRGLIWQKAAATNWHTLTAARFRLMPSHASGASLASFQCKGAMLPEPVEHRRITGSGL
jgi:hypothetical protein